MNQLKNILRRLIPSKVKEFIAYHPANTFGKLAFSQEGEDILLDRIFYDKFDGFYVDIGANHPFRFSNTYRLYNRGWCGINIEPNPEVIELFDNYRKMDIHVPLGISRQKGKLEYYYYKNSTLNTFDSELVQRRIQKPYKSEKVPTDTLANVLDQYLPKEKCIDVLNIDAEGFDFEVLKSNNWHKYRPRFILFEVEYGSITDHLASDQHRFLTNQEYSFDSKLAKTVIYRLE